MAREKRAEVLKRKHPASEAEDAGPAEEKVKKEVEKQPARHRKEALKRPKKTPVVKDEEGVAVPAKEFTPEDKSEAEEEQQEAGESAEEQPPPRRRGRPPKKRQSRRVSEQEEEDSHITENGRKIPIPPKHNKPVTHVRRKQTSTPNKERELLIHIRGSKNQKEVSKLPTVSVSISPNATLADLRAEIYAKSEHLIPRAQILYQEVDGEMDLLGGKDVENEVTLRESGLDLPGPCDIWVEIDFEAFFPPSGAAKPEAAGSPPSARRSRASREAPISSPAKSVKSKANSARGKQLVTVEEEKPADNEEEEAEEEAEEENESGKDEGSEPELVHMDFAASKRPVPPAAHFRPPKAIRPRPNKRWTAEDVEHLLTGLMKYGLSNWTKIAQRWQFKDRTTVDLKDKWRNLVKTVRENRATRGPGLSNEVKSRITRIMQQHGLAPP